MSASTRSLAPKPTPVRNRPAVQSNRPLSSSLKGARLLTVPEAADRLGMKPATVYRWIALRKLAITKFGRSRRAAVRISEAVLDQYIAAHTQPAWPATELVAIRRTPRSARSERPAGLTARLAAPGEPQ